MIVAAGILFISPEGRVLMLRRSGQGDMGGTWAFPGGHVEEGETLATAAARECLEETGYRVGSPGEVLCRRIKDDVDFTTFVRKVDEEFTPQLNDEHTAFAWVKPEEWEQNATHPGARAALQRLNTDELGIARLMAAGDVVSPQRYHNVLLLKLRVTGTGVSYRPSLNEYVYRRPENYLTPDFVARCNGLPVIWEHPETSILNSKEFDERIVGTVFLPYIQDDEVWAIAKIFNDDAISLIEKDQLSTSPAVLVGAEGRKVMPDGTKLLVEKPATLLDHLAICSIGVWDKGEGPAGIDVANSEGVYAMADEADKKEEDKKADAARADAEKLDLLLKGIDSLNSKVDACNMRMDAFEKEDMEKKDKARKDAEEEEEKEKKEKKDAAKKDAEMTEKEEPKELAADKARKDAEAKEEEEKKMDAARADGFRAAEAAFQKRLDEQNAAIKALQEMQKPLPDADRSALAAIQSRADSVYIQLGDQAKAPMMGETPAMYERRMVDGLRQFSGRWKDIPVVSLPDDVFSKVREQVYADAADYAKAPAVAAGKIREVVKRSPLGHITTEFYGGDGAHFVRDFTRRPQKLVGVITG